MGKIDGGEMLIRVLQQAGIDTIFTLHGGHLDAIFQAAAADGMRLIDTRHEQAAGHAGTLDDEIALLVVHGVLHILGHDHSDPDEAETMRARERDLLEQHHWNGPAPQGFRQLHPG